MSSIFTFQVRFAKKGQEKKKKVDPLSDEPWQDIQYFEINVSFDMEKKLIFSFLCFFTLLSFNRTT